MTGPSAYECMTAPARKAAYRISDGLGTVPQKPLSEREMEKLAAESVCHEIVDKAVAMFRARISPAHTTEKGNG